MIMTTLRELEARSNSLTLELYQALADKAPEIIKAKSLKVMQAAKLSPVIRQIYANDFDLPMNESRTRYIKWVKTNRRKLSQPYSLDRLYWLEDFHEAVAHTGGQYPTALSRFPFFVWYIAIRGNPIEGFPEDLNWWIALHRLWLIRTS